MRLSKMKPCPACGAQPEHTGESIQCSRRDSCWMAGPRDDHNGDKWNALPRRTDAHAGMLDGELIARCLIRVVRTLEEAHDLCMEWYDDIDEELDRHAAQRMPVPPSSSPDSTSSTNA